MPPSTSVNRATFTQCRWLTFIALRTLCACASLPVVLSAQPSGATGAPSLVTPPPEAAQFGFLVGEWAVTAKPKATTLAQRMHGVRALQGTWKAWRVLDGWGVEDELRLTDASGNPLLLSHTVRFYDRAARRWTNSAIDVYKGVVTQTSAERHGADLVVTGRGTDEERRSFTSRSTFSKVSASAFTYRVDRSMDGGKTWTEGVTVIEARRIAPTAPR